MPVRSARSPQPSPSAVPRSSRSPVSTLLAALLLALGTVGAVGLTGCGPDDEPDEAEEVATAPAPVERPDGPSYEIAPSTPFGDYGQFDQARLDSERLDDGWRTAADRARGNWDRYTTADGADGARSTASSGATGRRGATGTMDTSIPILRMRRSGAAGGAGGRSSGDSAGTTQPERAARPESWDAISPDALGGAPSLPVAREGGGPTTLRLQWMLDRVRFSPGVIDGRWGKNTEKAVYWLQHALGEEPTGAVDQALWDRLAAASGSGDAVVEHRLTADDVSGPFVDIPEEPTEKAELDCLCYTSLSEKLAERFHTTTDLLAQLNPDADLDSLSAGDSLWAPDVPARETRASSSGQGTASPGGADSGSAAGDDAEGSGGTRTKRGRPADRTASAGTGTGMGGGGIDRLVVSKDGFYLHALDATGQILYHFPVTVGSGYDASPDGQLTLAGKAWDPTFHYQPKLFSDVPDTDEEAMLPGGPNSPVGVIWMQLSKDNYGIHGTAEPQTIGYSTSHGCIRLTNWDAAFLGSRVAQGTEVDFGSAGDAGDATASDGSPSGSGAESGAS